MKKQGTLVLVRHGESRFNSLNLFTGNIDVSLSPQGLKEAGRVARQCKQFNYDVVFTSHLERAQETLLVILASQKKIGIFHHEIDQHQNTFENVPLAIKRTILPVYTATDLNERSYGMLQGMNKTTATKKYGASRVFEWRRSFEKRPPNGESLEDVYERVMPYFKRQIYPCLRKNQTVLVVAHGNTLRALIKYLENINKEDISSLDLPFAKPLIYTHTNDAFIRTDGIYSLHRPLR